MRLPRVEPMPGIYKIRVAPPKGYRDQVGRVDGEQGLEPLGVQEDVTPLLGDAVDEELEQGVDVCLANAFDGGHDRLHRGLGQRGVQEVDVLGVEGLGQNPGDGVGKLGEGLLLGVEVVVLEGFDVLGRCLEVQLVLEQPKLLAQRQVRRRASSVDGRTGLNRDLGGEDVLCYEKERRGVTETAPSVRMESDSTQSYVTSLLLKRSGNF